MKHILAGLISATHEKEEVLSTLSNIRYFRQHVLMSDIDKESTFVVNMALKYFDQTGGGLIDSDVFEAILAKSSLDQKAKSKNLSLFLEAQRDRVNYEKFKYFIDSFVTQKESNWIADIQTRAMLALESKYIDEKKVIYSGPEGASLLLAQIQFNNPYKRLSRSYPEGDIRLDGESIIQEYEQKKTGIVGQNEILSGFTKIDEPTGGFKRGELILIGAYTGEGKSMVLANIAHNACTTQRKNGVIITLETPRPIYRRRIITRHACMPSIGRANGLDSSKIRDGKLSKEEELLFLKVVKDYSDNPDYGYLDIVQMKRSSTIPDIFSKFEEINAKVPLDYCMIDYFTLVTASRKRNSRREEIEEILQEAKDGALSFDNGKGITCFGAAQLKQTAREKVKAEDSKFYTIRDFSDSSELGESADCGIMILRTDELKDANEIAAKIVKLRDGEGTEMFKLYERYSSSYLGNLGT